MAKCGVASRRKSEELILQGNVKVNDEVIKELGHKIEPKKDIVLVNNTQIKLEDKKIYIMLNKPTGYITSVKDQFNRPTVLTLIKDIEERIYPIGRLDYDTSGLIILTNDGNITYKLTHPKHEVIKTYIAKVKGIPGDSSLEKFRNGLEIDGYKTSKAEIEILRKFNNSSLLEIKIHEGRNRQVRKMCDKIGHPVINLKRVSMGNLNLGDLGEGKWRFLKENEVEYLKNS